MSLTAIHNEGAGYPIPSFLARALLFGRWRGEEAVVQHMAQQSAPRLVLRPEDAICSRWDESGDFGSRPRGR